MSKPCCFDPLPHNNPKNWKKIYIYMSVLIEYI